MRNTVNTRRIRRNIESNVHALLTTPDFKQGSRFVPASEYDSWTLTRTLRVTLRLGQGLLGVTTDSDQDCWRSGAIYQRLLTPLRPPVWPPARDQATMSNSDSRTDLESACSLPRVGWLLRVFGAEGGPLWSDERAAGPRALPYSRSMKRSGAAGKTVPLAASPPQNRRRFGGADGKTQILRWWFRGKVNPRIEMPSSVNFATQPRVKIYSRICCKGKAY